MSLIITDCFKFDTAVDSGQVQEKVTLCNEWLNEIAVQPEYIPLLMVRTCALADLVVSLTLSYVGFLSRAWNLSFLGQMTSFEVILKCHALTLSQKFFKLRPAPSSSVQVLI